MAIKKLSPYLTFDGTAAQAIKLYEKVLGAKVEHLSRFGDVDSGHPSAPEFKDRIMHAALRLGEGLLMISDGMPGVPVPTQSNVHVTLDYDDVAEMTKAFEALSAGGQVTMPLNDTFWGAKFGMLKDAFAINWMFNCELKKA